MNENDTDLIMVDLDIYGLGILFKALDRVIVLLRSQSKDVIMNPTGRLFRPCQRDGKFNISLNR